MTLILSIVAIIVAIIAILIPIYRENKNKKLARIEAVAIKYSNLSESNRSTLINALIQSGMSNLNTEAEAKKAIEIIFNKNKKHPLTNYKDKIEEVGILRFFKRITLSESMNGQIDVVITELRQNTK